MLEFLKEAEPVVVALCLVGILLVLFKLFVSKTSGFDPSIFAPKGYLSVDTSSNRGVNDVMDHAPYTSGKRAGFAGSMGTEQPSFWGNVTPDFDQAAEMQADYSQAAAAAKGKPAEGFAAKNTAAYVKSRSAFAGSLEKSLAGM